MARKAPYTARDGSKRFKPIVTESEVMDGTTGFCIACGKYKDGVEPDARKYSCDSCGALKVFGLEELALMGLLILKGGRAA